MTLYFVRHGETDWNVKKKIQGKTDIPLNENGRAQAESLAAVLRAEKEEGNLNAVRVYTSPQLRALRTAEIAAAALDVECVSLEGLREMDLGDWEGMRWEVIQKQYGEIYEYWNTHRRYTHTPGGESYNEVLGRTLDALAFILARERVERIERVEKVEKVEKVERVDKEESVESGDVIIVTHSAVLMALRCYLAGRPFEEMLSGYKTGNAKVVPVSGSDIMNVLARYAAGE